VVIGIAEKRGLHISFIGFMKVAFPLMLMSILISTGYLLFWHYFHTMTAMVVTLALGVLLGLLLRTVAAKKIYKPAVKSPSDSEA
jgi:positive regulator of sigma E activity